MNLSKKDSADHTQLEAVKSESTKQNPSASPLDGLLNLLFELKSTDEIQPSASESPQEAAREDVSKSTPQLMDTVSQNSKQDIETSAAAVEKTAEPSPNSNQDADNTDSAFAALQNLLIEPGLADVRQLMTKQDKKLAQLEHQIYEPQALTSLLLPVMEEFLQRKLEEIKTDFSHLLTPVIQEVAENQIQRSVKSEVAQLEQKITDLEHQIYDRTALIDLLMPVIVELLNRKVAESSAAVTHALMPIIDDMIESKFQEDGLAMSTALAPILPASISQQITNAPQEVALAIAPEMASAIKEQIRIERDAMVDALYPIIGSTINKQIAETISQINDRIDNAISPESLQRKIRAKIQGVSEAELLLKEETPFTVQAIFLIQKGSGLIISEVQAPGNQRLESEMVAGMLTAIRSFINDCIAQSGSIAEINEIEYGDSKIILEVAGYCYLALVVQGTPPYLLIKRMRTTLEGVVLNYGKAIESFDGDSAKVPEQISSILAAFRENASKPRKQKGDKTGKPSPLLLCGLILLGLIGIPWGFFHYRSWVNHRIEARTALALDSTPELSIYRLNVDADGRTLKLSGKVPNQLLRSKAEQIAKSVAPTLQLDNKIIAVEVPADPGLASAEVSRVTSILNQIEGVFISTRYQGGKVTVEGSVSKVADANNVTQAFEKIPGVQAVTNTVNLKPLAISIRFYFNPASATIQPVDILKILQIKDFLNQYPAKKLKIIGHSNSLNEPGETQQLALERAQNVQVALINQGIDPKRLEVVKTTSSPTNADYNQPLWLSRYVDFEIE